MQALARMNANLVVHPEFAPTVAAFFGKLNP
jgi:hypothetical protein